MAVDNLEVANSALNRLGAKSITLLTEETDRARLCNRFLVPCRRQTLRAHPWNVALRRAKLSTFSGANATITLGALTGDNISVVASGNVFSDPRDVGSLIKAHGTNTPGIARITDVVSANEAVVDIETDFVSLALPVEEWRFAPAWEWSYRYDKPSDYLRVAEVASVSGLSTNIIWSWWSIRGQRDNSPEPVKAEGEGLVADVGPEMLIKYIFDLTDTTKWDPLLEEAIISFLAFRISYGVTGSLQAGKTHHDAWKEALAEARSIDGQEGTGDDSGSDVLLACRG